MIFEKKSYFDGFNACYRTVRIFSEHIFFEISLICIIIPQICLVFELPIFENKCQDQRQGQKSEIQQDGCI